MMGVDCSNGWRHGHYRGIRYCLCHRDGHNRWVSVRASLVSLLVDPVSEIRFPRFEPSVLVQMLPEVRLAAETPSAVTQV